MPQIDWLVHPCVELNPIYITPNCYRAIYRWSMCSRKEINVICFGKGSHIVKVVRLRNIERYPRHSTSYNNTEYEDVIKTYMGKFDLVAEAHNHFGGPARLSKGDWQALAVGHTELVFCCRSQKLTAWQIKKTWKQTLKSGKVVLVVKGCKT